jgi:predicted Fe-Mo cluster-binding NifX family protein
MKVCFPVLQDDGMNSKVYNHFGSAPLFIVVDTEKNGTSAISNGDQRHARSASNPLQALDNQQVDAVIVGGIGGGALTRLNQSGIRVYRAQSQTVQENMALFTSMQLLEFTRREACRGHGHGGKCAN